MNNMVEYNCLPGKFVIANKKLLLECSMLYSKNYGSWGNEGCNPGESVRLSPDRLCRWLNVGTEISVS